MNFRLGGRSFLVASLFAAFLPITALAQGATATQPPPTDPLVATVNGQPIHLSDVEAAAASLPPNVRAMPPEILYPKLIDSLVNQRALAVMAQKEGLAKDPQIQQQIDAATGQILANALLRKQIMPTITDAALHARYDSEIANKPGEEEVHAKHILVPTEDQAKQIIAQLENGADFATLAKKYSKDSGAADGGDLGFFKKGDMVPTFADAAFALKPGEFTKTPVHTQFGWHVILVVARRQVQPPTFDQAKDQLRQEMLKQGIEKAVAQARQAADVKVYNLNGSPPKATDNAIPPAPKQ
jgi:peptidyl-prolyl cis-trans isomerase C